ncbi:hypothetical protein BTC22_08520 [Salmonella enterica]|nr:hypothetical protein [Salmonella enterica]
MRIRIAEGEKQPPSVNQSYNQRPDLADACTICNLRHVRGQNNPSDCSARPPSKIISPSGRQSHRRHAGA